MWRGCGVLICADGADGTTADRRSGGSGDGGRSNALLRAPIKQYGKWETVVAKGTPPPPRSGHTASVVAGEMWVYGTLCCVALASLVWRRLGAVGGDVVVVVWLCLQVVRARTMG